MVSLLKWLLFAICIFVGALATDQNESMDWFQYQRDNDNVVQLLSQSIEHYGEINENAESSFLLLTEEAEMNPELHCKLQFISDNKSMDWFQNLDQCDKDNVVQLLSQSIQHYGEINESVIKDMEEKFGIIPSQTQQLYEFLYLEKIQTPNESVLVINKNLT